MSSKILVVENVSKNFGDQTLFSNMSMTLQMGEIYNLTGPSGTGKSTFLKGLVGLVEFSSGVCRYFPDEEHSFTMPEIRSKIHYINQFLPSEDHTVQNYIEQVFDFDVYAERTLSLDELSAYLDKFSFSSSILTKKLGLLSGGEFQIIRFIRSLLLRPMALLLDESTSAMDGALKNKFESILLEKVNEGLSIVSVSHDHDHLERLGGQKITFHHLE